LIKVFLKIMDALGIPSSSPRMDAITPANAQVDEVVELAAVSRARFRSEPEVVIIDLTPPKPGMCSGDLDLERGGLKSDYLVTRRLRAAAEAFEKRKPKEIYLLGDVRPK